MKKYMQLIFSSAILVFVCTFFIVPFAWSKTIDQLSFERSIETIDQSFVENLNKSVGSIEILPENTNAWDWNCQVDYIDSGGNEEISINTIIAYGAKSFENNDPQWFSSSNDLLPAPVPEPSTILLLGIGLIGIEELRRKFIKLQKN